MNILSYIQTRYNFLFLIVFLIGAWIMSLDLGRPVNGTVRESWRECDIAAIARNYYQESMNFFYPRIDWRGDGPGYVEMEFPIYPWAIALMYKIFGFNEIYGRLISYALSLLTIIVFFKLARYLLSEIPALLASIFYILSPLVIRISNSLQPEPLMLLFYILAVYSFIRWIEEQNVKFYYIALIATASAILAKPNVAHLGIMFLGISVLKDGIKTFIKPENWIFAIFALAPAAIWYLYSNSFWVNYGNSLGLSNEYHWVGWDFFTNPHFIKEILHLELLNVWMPAGFIVILSGLFSLRKNNNLKYPLLWITAIFIYYIVASRTVADKWAVYYHVVSVAPFALLFGIGFEYILNCSKDKKVINFHILSTLVIGIFIIFIYNYEFVQLSKFSKFIIISVSAGIITIYTISHYFKRISNPDIFNKRKIRNTLVILILLFCVSATFISQSIKIGSELHPSHMQNYYECAIDFKPLIPKGDLIIASGGICFDETGYPVAYNAPYMFYWTERKGFSICLESQSLYMINSLMKRGAKYFIAERGKLSKNERFETQMKNKYRIIKECQVAVLFDLTIEN